MISKAEFLNPSSRRLQFRIEFLSLQESRTHAIDNSHITMWNARIMELKPPPSSSSSLPKNLTLRVSLLWQNHVLTLFSCIGAETPYAYVGIHRHRGGGRPDWLPKKSVLQPTTVTICSCPPSSLEAWQRTTTTTTRLPCPLELTGAFFLLPEKPHI